MNPVVTDTTSTPIGTPAGENFESGSKTDYTPSTITLSTGKWSFDNAVIGTGADDKKNGSKSARIREMGKLSMNFDVVNGVYIVTIAHAVYGNDSESSWELWASSNSGGTYAKVGNTISTQNAGLKVDTFIINIPTKQRFQIRKVSGGSNQLNIDDINIIRSATPPPPGSDNDNMLMGNPSSATTSLIDYSNFLIIKPYYALSYNREEGKANWVSWHVNMSDKGTTPRQDDFREDPSLPSSWYHVSNISYTGSGFDRGHYCPSVDRTASVDMNSSTFLMTNIMPQAPMNNQRTWEYLEDSCHRLVLAGNELYIIAGSYGTGGTGNNGLASTIDNQRITVPSTLWKVIVVIPNGNNDISRINSSTRVITVKMSNDNNTIGDWKLYRTSIQLLEAAIGNNFKLLSNLPQSVQDVLKARVDDL